MRLRRYAAAASVLLAACALSSCSRSSANNPADIAAITAKVNALASAVSAKDINGIMAYYVPDESLIVFDAVPPRQYVGAAAFRKDWQGILDLYPGAAKAEITDLKVETEGSLGYSRCIFRVFGPDKDGKPQDFTVRVTDIFKKINGEWKVVHEHDSWPVDIATGKADFNSKL